MNVVATRYYSHSIAFSSIILIYIYVLLYETTEPWLHVGMFGLGAYVGHKLPLWERAMVESVNEDLRAQGLPPLVGTRAFFPENYAANFAPKPKEKEDS
jgi:hypothetical protein